MSLGYCNLGDYSKAIDLSNDAIALFQTEQDSLNLALCYNNRGIIHTYINEYQQADRFLKKALELNRSSHDLKRIAANLNNLCLYKGDIKEQLKWINEAIVINKNLNAKWSLSENYNNLGKLYIYAGKYSQAIDALKTAYRIASEVGAKGQMCERHRELSNGLPKTSRPHRTEQRDTEHQQAALGRATHRTGKNVRPPAKGKAETTGIRNSHAPAKLHHVPRHHCPAYRNRHLVVPALQA